MRMSLTENVSARSGFTRRRRRPIKRRLIFAAIGLAILLLALAGWAVQAFRPAR